MSGRRLPWNTTSSVDDASNPGDSALQHRMDRRAVVTLAAGGALGLPVARAVAQSDAPPIEPIGPDAPEGPDAPVTISPEEAMSPDASSVETVDGSASGDELYFASTGHNLGKPFLETWRASGGFDVFGVALSEARYIADEHQTHQTHQTFETLTMTYDPDLSPDMRIQGLPLEQTVIDRIAPASARKNVTGGHSIGQQFQTFWGEHGDTRLFGEPVSEPFARNGGTSQVFEKVVMDADASGAVMLRKLGPEWVQKADLESDKAFLPAPPNNGEASLVSTVGGLRLRNAPSLESDILVVLPENAEFVAVQGESGTWVPGYVDGFSGWVSAEYLKAPEMLAPVGASDWDPAIWQGAALGETYVRAEPTTASADIRILAAGEPLTVVDWVKGEEVVENSYIWAQSADGNFIFARNVGRAAPVTPPPLGADAPSEGKWIDVHLTQQLMVAYEGRTPVRTVVTTTGMPGWETPPGWYAINTRVENETMTSGAIGAEYHYKLEDVLYTQYFSDRGHALHYAWWRTPETIGRPGSHGCLNMLLEDSEFFWNWAAIGTPVIVRTT